MDNKNLIEQFRNTRRNLKHVKGEETKTLIDYNLLGKRVKEERLKLRLTQEQLAKTLHTEISSAFIGHIERGERSLSLETLVDICQRLGVTIDYLLTESYSPDNIAVNEELLQLVDGKTLEQKRAAIDVLRTLLRHL